MYKNSLTAVPRAPGITVVHTTQTAATVRITPSADIDGSPVNYTLFWRSHNLGGHYANLTVTKVMQDQTLSPLVADMRYDVYVEATNIVGSTKSKVIAAVTRQEGKTP